MSIPVLTQVYQEVRRLAIAGSVVAPGDFRLKKLLPSLDAAAEKAPVVAKVAEAARNLIDGPEAQSAQSLLELTAIVSAILATQGATGCPGTLEPLETTPLNRTTTHISAQLLKQTQDALERSGGGRLDFIRDAHRQGVFRDLRMVFPALKAIESSYAELVDYLADRVLPEYGPAIVPILRSQFQLSGGRGHPRRLILLAKLDPEGTRSLVQECLENGGKDVKIAAISLLRDENLPELRKFAQAKSQDIRLAAFQALSKIDHPEAKKILATVLEGKDLGLVCMILQREATPAFLAPVLTEAIHRECRPLLGTTDPSAISTAVERLVTLIRVLPKKESPESDRVLLELFEQRQSFLTIRGESYSGSDLVETIIQTMALGSPEVQSVLARAHATIPPERLKEAVVAACASLPAAEVYELFSPYLQVMPDTAKQSKLDPKQKAALESLIHGFQEWRSICVMNKAMAGRPVDARWVAAAIRLGRLDFLRCVVSAHHPEAEAFLSALYDAARTEQKFPEPFSEFALAMIQLEHPRAAEVVMTWLEVNPGHRDFFWISQMIQKLPTAALPRFQELVARLPESSAKQVQDLIDRLLKTANT